MSYYPPHLTFPPLLTVFSMSLHFSSTSIQSIPHSPFAFSYLTHSLRWLMEPSPPQPAEQRNNHAPSPSSSSSLPMPSSRASPNTTAPGLMGKHRMAAAISYLNQQIQIIQDELDELETIGGVSTVCPELISTVDAVPDALLPVTRGPADVGWERWFQGTPSSRGRRRWI
ncbi:uncharacterized protein LOC105164967 [Sesamum indicum]|uniref:Uncharacterized protein LOC105164967 n=1 Tax=Sesamum indicum TaxID=4182 RepID=A0A6I9TBJ8_SESIN|nr:uncharacterized protein LOC105164967 [Sesamum indicum]